MSGAPLTTTFPLFVGDKFAPERVGTTIPSAIARDLSAAALASKFPAGTAFALFCYRHRGALEIRVIVRGLGNNFLFEADGSLTPEAAELHTVITAIASAYNSVSGSTDDPCAPPVYSLYRLEVTLETDIERRHRHRRFAALSVLAVLWVVAGLAAGIAVIVSTPAQSPLAHLAIAALCSVLAPIGFASHMACRWTTPAATPSDSEDAK